MCYWINTFQFLYFNVLFLSQLKSPGSMFWSWNETGKCTWSISYPFSWKHKKCSQTRDKTEWKSSLKCLGSARSLGAFPSWGAITQIAAIYPAQVLPSEALTIHKDALLSGSNTPEGVVMFSDKKDWTRWRARTIRFQIQNLKRHQSNVSLLRCSAVGVFHVITFYIREHLNAWIVSCRFTAASSQPCHPQVYWKK